MATNLPRHVGDITLHLQDFDGPLDLLLHLIKQAEMDIYDIEISAITDQYMAVLRQETAHQLEVAGEYFVIAATLMAIKSEMLLPQPTVEFDPEPDETIDPREELVSQLLEYQRYKQAAANLKDKEQERAQAYTREAMAVPTDLIQASFAPGVSLDELQAAFAAVMKRHHFSEPATQTIQAEPITVAERIDHVLATVTGPTRFEDLFADAKTRDNLITTLMAILDLAKYQAIKIEQSAPLAPIIILPGAKKAEYQHG